MQRLLILAMMALLSGCSSTDKLIENLSENVVGIRYQDRGVIGTGGVVLTKKGKVILTNWHVCLPFLMGNVRPGADKFKNLRILKHDSTLDLCALTVPAKLKAPGLKLNTNKLRLFSRLIAEGYPAGGELTPTEGRILKRKRLPVGNPIIPFLATYYDLYMTSIHSYPGNSGSPVIDMNGDLVGVLESSNNLSFYGNMIPADLVAKFIKGL